MLQLEKINEPKSVFCFNLQILFVIFLVPEYFSNLLSYAGVRGGVVYKALRYKPGGRRFDSR
jgi:hypothetical protein